MVTDLISAPEELKPLTYSIGDIIEIVDDEGRYGKFKVQAVTDKRLYLDIIKPQ